MLDKEQIINTIRNEVDLVKYNVNSLALFGSFAKDKQTEDSDIDLLYTFKSSENIFDNYFELKEELEMTFMRKVDLLPRKTKQLVKFAIFIVGDEDV